MLLKINIILSYAVSQYNCYIAKINPRGNNPRGYKN